MLTEKQILDFQKIYKEKFGKEISKEDAYKQGQKLINLLEEILLKIPIEPVGKD